MAVTGGYVAEVSSFPNFEEKKRKSNLLMLFPKIVNQMGHFGQIRQNSLCRPILDNLVPMDSTKNQGRQNGKVSLTQF